MKDRMGRIRAFKVFYRRFGVYLYVLLACGLILLGVSKHPILEKTRAVIADFSGEMASVLYKPFQGLGYIGEYVGELWDMHDKNLRLKEENGKLLYWVNRAQQLKQENDLLKKELGFVVPPSGKAITAYIVADNGGSFARSVLVQAGKKAGVRKGFVALYNAGLLGRIVSVGQNSSRLLLLTDYASRVPVTVGEKRYLGIVAGNNSSVLYLTSLPEGAVVREGDYITTSGHAGVFPMGLAVGTVSKVGKEKIEVTPFVSREDVDFVRLVDFGVGGLLPSEATLEEQE